MITTPTIEEEKKPNYDNNTPFMYIFIRTDLSREQQIVQAAHAAHEAGMSQGAETADYETPHICLIGAADWSELSEAEAYLDENEIGYEIFWEPDIKQHTAIATHSLRGEERKPFAHFPTLKF